MDKRRTMGPLTASAANAMAGRASLGGQAPGRMSMGAKPARLSTASVAGNGGGGGPRLSYAPRHSTASVSSIRKSASTGLQGRRSTLGGARGGGSSAGARPDPRPITDKGYMSASIRALVEYLTNHGYGHTISPKILTRPTGRDFQHIVGFLFSRIDPCFVERAAEAACPLGAAHSGVVARFEDTVIQMYKALRYPFPLSKTALVAVGSPHTWPPLLAAVMWLVELLSYDEVRTDNTVRVSWPRQDSGSPLSTTHSEHTQHARSGCARTTRTRAAARACAARRLASSR